MSVREAPRRCLGVIGAVVRRRSVPPGPPQALIAANSLGPKEGRALLEAWGHEDLADGFYSAWRREMVPSDERLIALADEYYRFNKVEYPGEPLSEPGRRVLQAMAAWVQHMEARSRAEQ